MPRHNPATAKIAVALAAKLAEPEIRILPAPGSTGCQPVPGGYQPPGTAALMHALASGPGTGLKRLDFGPTKTPSPRTKTQYPTLPDPTGQAAELAAVIIDTTHKVKSLESALEVAKADLKALATPFYFQTNQGRAEVPSSITVNVSQNRRSNGSPSPVGTGEGRGEGFNHGHNSLLLTFANRYPLLDTDAPLYGILDDARVVKYFGQTFTFKIDGDKLPAAHAGEIYGELREVLARFNCTDAMTVKDGIAPKADFHVARHTALTVDENLSLNAMLPIIVSVKATK